MSKEVKKVKSIRVSKRTESLIEKYNPNDSFGGNVEALVEEFYSKERELYIQELDSKIEQKRNLVKYYSDSLREVAYSIDEGREKLIDIIYKMKRE